MSLEQLLRQGFDSWGLPLDTEAQRRYRLYYEALEQTNQVMNLTAISGEEDVARLHFLDSAALLTLADFRGAQVIDVGTGAGFPGLAMKIACPEMKLTLLDSLDKRVGFLRRCCGELGLEDVVCIHGRAEEIPEGYREHFDFAVSRAVARLNLLCELCLPYVRPGGAFLAMKGPELETELREAYTALRTLGGTVERRWDYTIPGTDVTHSAVLIHKEKSSPARYPRRWAQIKKNPL